MHAIVVVSGQWETPSRTLGVHWVFGDARFVQRGLVSRGIQWRGVFVEFSFFKAGEGGGLHAKSFLLEQSKADFDNSMASGALAVHPGLGIRASIHRRSASFATPASVPSS